MSTTGRADLPDFIIIGAQKAGTTSLWTYLRSHPQVFLPAVKELNFFAAEGTWDRGLDWYRSMFAGRSDEQVAGEASPGYTMFPIFAGAPERMASVVPGAKLVYLIREPISRMVSNWVQSSSDGLEQRSLGEALLMDVRYVSLSQYATQLERYLEHFDRGALLVLRAEDLAERPTAIVKQVCAFVGADPDKVGGDLTARHNPSEQKGVPRHRTLALTRLLRRAGQADLAYRITTTPRALTHRRLLPEETALDDDLRARLRAYLQPDIARLRAIVGPDVDLWGYA